MAYIQTIGIVGKSPFTAFLESVIPAVLPDVTVHMHTPQSEHMPETPLEEVCLSDVVIFIPTRLQNFEALFLKLLPLLGDDTIFIDVSLPKCLPTAVLKKHASDKKYVSVRPLFGPKTYESNNNSLEGFRVLVFDYTVPQEEYEAACDFMRNFGMKIIDNIDVETHDKIFARTFFISQYIAHIGMKMNFEETEYSTPSFDSFVKTIGFAENLPPNLLGDYYKACSHCRNVVDELHASQKRVEKRFKGNGKFFK